MRNMELSLKSVKKRFCQKSESFSELISLKLIGCEDDDIVCLPLEMSEVLYNIEEFIIEDARKLIQVFETEELSRSNNNDVQRCARLKKLTLWNLPKLMHVWKESSEVTTISFDSLENIDIRGCENLKCILASSVTFLNLKYLTVGECSKMMNLFSSTVAENLGNLETTKIYDCREMRCIVAAEEGEEENGEIVLKNLKRIFLHGSPRLACFHNGKCTITFPWLEGFYIYGLYETETFSHGILSFPKLKSMKIDKREFKIAPGQDINAIIHKRYRIIII